MAGKTKSVAIIGGGASGAVVLDTLVKEEAFEEIVLYERRDVLGGVWVLDEKPDELDVPPGVGQEVLDPPLAIPEFQEQLRAPRSTQQRYVHTPCYKDLRTNTPELTMTYSDRAFWDTKDGERIEEKYVRAPAVQRYIEAYLKRHEDHIVYRTSVEDVNKDYTVQDAPFELVLRTETDEVDSEGRAVDVWTKRTFDAVIVATGHYHVPSIPDVPGIDEVYRQFPKLIIHSKTLRSVDQFRDQTLVVIGSRASGADIVDFGAEYAAKIYQSKRSKVHVRPSSAENIELKPLVSKYEVVDGDVLVHFEDGSTVTNPDKIIYATGFRFSYPFLKRSYPNFTTGYIIPDLFQHTFYTKDPQLSLVGVPTDAISFRAFEYQTIWISRYLAQKVALPPLEEQIRWGLTRYREKGNTRAYHTIDWGKKFEYWHELTRLGGGVGPIGTAGRAFHVETQEEIELQNSIKERLLGFFSVDEGTIA